jgi:hypothetical protein
MPSILRYLFRTFLQPKKIPVSEMVSRVFSDPDRGFAKDFYASWSPEEYLLVEIGRGDHDLFDKQAFYANAFFYFHSQPTDIGQFWILGADAESEMGMIVLEKEKNKVYYAYENTDPETLTELATSFREFIEELKRAGWQPPIKSQVS